jgi:septum formation protein
MKPHPDLILASASPRRRELLELLGLVLRIEPVDVDETPAPGEKARAYAQRLAAEKGEAALTRLGQETLPVLTADTVVVVGDDILGKPANQDEAAAMLRRLAGRRGLDQWVEVWEKLTHLFAQAEGINLDRKQVVLNAFFALEEAAR